MLGKSSKKRIVRSGADRPGKYIYAQDGSMIADMSQALEHPSMHIY